MPESLTVKSKRELPFSVIDPSCQIVLLISMKLIVFDCDSTLSSIEGIDELARVAGPEAFTEVESLTHAAMNGQVPIDEVFEKRLDIIRPSKSLCDEVAKLYIETVEPTAKDTLEKLRENGWNTVILSGGFKMIIEPLAEYLGVERIEAVPLEHDGNGNYVKFDNTYPTTYNGGKPEIIKALKSEYQPDKVVMVGDGVSDLETAPDVDLFVGYGRYTPRDKVKAEAEEFITSLDSLLHIV